MLRSFMQLWEVAFASRRHGNGGASDWRRQLEGNGSKNGISLSSMCFIDLPLQKIAAAARVCDCGRVLNSDLKVLWKCMCRMLIPRACVCVCWFYSRDRSVLLLINPALTMSKDSNTEDESPNQFPGYSWSVCTSDAGSWSVCEGEVSNEVTT